MSSGSRHHIISMDALLVNGAIRYHGTHPSSDSGVLAVRISSSLGDLSESDLKMVFTKAVHFMRKRHRKTCLIVDVCDWIKPSMFFDTSSVDPEMIRTVIDEIDRGLDMDEIIILHNDSFLFRIAWSRIGDMGEEARSYADRANLVRATESVVADALGKRLAGYLLEPMLEDIIEDELVAELMRHPWTLNGLEMQDLD